MSIASVALYKAIVAAWDSEDLDAKFTALWPTGASATQFTALLADQEAQPGQPLPYAVMDQFGTDVITRMSNGDDRYETRDVIFAFHVFADEVAGDSRSAKAIAAYLAEEIMKVFGGHATESPAELTLETGNHLITQYQNDYGLRDIEDVYRWVVTYRFLLDVPVAN
jgi:hypothetical protein